MPQVQAILLSDDDDFNSTDNEGYEDPDATDSDEPPKTIADLDATEPPKTIADLADGIFTGRRAVEDSAVLRSNIWDVKKIHQIVDTSDRASSDLQHALETWKAYGFDGSTLSPQAQEQRRTLLKELYQVIIECDPSQKFLPPSSIRDDEVRAERLEMLRKYEATTAKEPDSVDFSKAVKKIIEAKAKLRNQGKFCSDLNWWHNKIVIMLSGNRDPYNEILKMLKDNDCFCPWWDAEVHKLTDMQTHKIKKLVGIHTTLVLSTIKTQYIHLLETSATTHRRLTSHLTDMNALYANAENNKRNRRKKANAENIKGKRRKKADVISQSEDTTS